jgi:hypothetical protein
MLNPLLHCQSAVTQSSHQLLSFLSDVPSSSLRRVRDSCSLCPVARREFPRLSSTRAIAPLRGECCQWRIIATSRLKLVVHGLPCCRPVVLVPLAVLLPPKSMKTLIDTDCCRPVVLVPRSERAGLPEGQRPYTPLHIQPDSRPRAQPPALLLHAPRNGVLPLLDSRCIAYPARNRATHRHHAMTLPLFGTHVHSMCMCRRRLRQPAARPSPRVIL